MLTVVQDICFTRQTVNMAQAAHSSRTKEEAGAPIRKRPADRSMTDALDSIDKANSPCPAPYVQDGSKLVILQQPQKHGQRFRYQMEERNPGILLAEGSDATHKKFIKVEVQGMPLDETAIMIISCVTVKEPYRPHPHMLQGDHCKKGVYMHKFCGQLELTKLGIKCVKKSDRKQTLDHRKEMAINPFNTSYDTADVDTNSIRLCFQVYRKDEFGKYHRPLEPVLSVAILDKKSTGQLCVVRYSPASGPANEKTEIMLFCSKVTKNDIKVCFEEEGSDWTAEVDISAADIHHLYALAFHTPLYKDCNIESDRQVQFHLCRPSDGEVSPSFDFIYKASDPQKRTSLKKSKTSADGNYQNFHKEVVHRPPNVPTLCDDIQSLEYLSVSPTKAQSLETELPPGMAVVPAWVSPGTRQAPEFVAAYPSPTLVQLKAEGSPLPSPAPLVSKSQDAFVAHTVSSRYTLNQLLAPTQDPQQMIQRLQQMGFMVVAPKAVQGLVALDTSPADMHGLISEESAQELDYNDLSFNAAQLLQDFESQVEPQNDQSEAVELMQDVSVELPEA